MLKIKYKNLILVSYAILLFPVILFFLFWLRFGIGIISSTLIIYAAYKFYVNNYRSNMDVIELKTRIFAICSIIILIWLWTANIGEMFVSGYDWPWRNAMFNDLVNYKWPIIYNNQNSFVYYMFFWLIPTFFGKIFGITVAKLIIILFSYLLIMLVLIHIRYYIGIKNSKFFVIISLIFIFWSGVNILGQYIANFFGVGPGFNVLGVESWLDRLNNGYSFNFLFRSNRGVIKEIYNQMPIWLVIILFISSKNLDACVFVCLLALPYAPLPFLGLIPFACVRFIYQFIQCKSIIKVIKESFSLTNILFIISFIPIFSYFLTNNTSGFIKFIPMEQFDKIRLFMLLIFYLSQFGILVAIIRNNTRYKQLYITSIVFLTICPLVEFGKFGDRDFVMNASIPSFFIIMIVFVDFFISKVIDKPFKLYSFFSVVYIVLMCFTTIGYLGIDIYLAVSNRHIPVLIDHANVGGTLEGKDQKAYVNFLVSNYKDKIFYKYFAKKINK